MEANPFFLMIYFYLVHRVHMLQLIMS